MEQIIGNAHNPHPIVRPLPARPAARTAANAQSNEQPDTARIGAPQLTERHHRYWRQNLRITSILIGIWFVVTFVVGFFARDLNFKFFGWPFSFWVAAQGALMVYVVIIWYYARYMNRLDREYGVAEED